MAWAQWPTTTPDTSVLVRGGETIQDQEKVATLTRLDNGQYTLSVDNLTYEAAGMGIGNVVIDSIDAVGNPDQPGVTDLGVAKSIRISSGTISGFPVWVGSASWCRAYRTGGQGGCWSALF